EGLFDYDPQPANAALGARLKSLPFFRFVPVLNPTLPNWERALMLCQQQFAAVAVRLHPNYHGYDSQHAGARALMQAANTRRLPVIVQLRMQDVRAMHPLAQVPDTDWKEALALALFAPETPVIVSACSWTEINALRPRLEDAPNLYLTLTHAEYVDGVRRFVEKWGTHHLLFGTHAPLFTPTAARMKVEAACLNEADLHALVRGNAEQIWKEGT
ncbi:MAG TPA: amidohydrolase family protein, partial [Chthonomonadaceae bacterium]|nr:amidohydrolase family protein [Chthonomonadaceae bacterium]